MTAPLPPPQGVMAPADALAVLDDARLVVEEAGYRAIDAQMIAARATFAALLARCEGLEAALGELLPLAEAWAGHYARNYGVANAPLGAFHPQHQAVIADAETKLAATRATGGE